MTKFRCFYNKKKSVIVVTPTPKRRGRNRLKIHIGGKMNEGLLPIATTDLLKGVSEYDLPKEYANRIRSVVIMPV